MRNYSLNTDEIDQLIQWKKNSEAITSKELKLALDEAQGWETQVACLALLFARVLERNPKGSFAEKQQQIEMLYSLQDEICFDIEEGDECFTGYLLGHLRNPDDSLEEALVDLLNRYRGKDYEHALCR